MPLYVTMQNAGIIIRRAAENFTLEWFQASPRPGDVTSTTGKLVMQFPVRPRLPFPADESAIKSLCAFLADLDCTKMHDALPTTKKAGCIQEETRDVVDIRYISELLGGIARGMTENPDSAAESTQFITKRINDHVRYFSAEKPWRRDPIWLVVRVALQTTLQEYGVDGLYGYKSFITFLLSTVLEKALLLEGTTPQDHLLYVMNAKIAIRLQKASEIVSSVFPFSEIAKVVRKCSSTLERNWSNIQTSTTPVFDLTPPTVEEIQSSCGFSLTNSKGYLSEVYNRQLELNTVSQHFDVDRFVDSLELPSQRSQGISPPSDIPENISEADRWIAIQDIENWICQGLNNWRASLSTDLKSINSASNTLRGLILTLHHISKSLKNPVLFSRLMLMNLELWVALDKLTVVNVPLLADYSPGLCPADFEPLLLPTLEQMERFHQVETYLKMRHQQANNDLPSMFRSDDSCNSFGYRFSRESTFATNLQNIRGNIQREESREWMKKKEELKELEEQYQRCLDYTNTHDHDTSIEEDVHGYKRTVHPYYSCTRCKNEVNMKSLKIEVFERYLPSDDFTATLVIFELAMPAFIRIWRDITYILARDNQTSQLSNAAPEVILESYGPLSQFSSIPIWRVITLASTTKPFLSSHYSNVDLPCSEGDIYKANALQYNQYDSTERAWMDGCPAVAIRQRCTPTLSTGPYASLSWTVKSTTHTPNQVIARQNECHSELSWHEWCD
ncbi:MAG TPA: hypothetical protein VGO47_13975, partial [Chlamydiales bacterium]|nr:hypothetical protein [Chlamydiales bacterium]